MNTITTKDGTQLYFKDWGKGQPVVVPIDAAGRASAKLVKGAKLIVYSGAPHGLTDTHKDKVNNDLLKFIQS